MGRVRGPRKHIKELSLHSEASGSHAGVSNFPAAQKPMPPDFDRTLRTAAFRNSSCGHQMLSPRQGVRTTARLVLMKAIHSEVSAQWLAISPNPI